MEIEIIYQDQDLMAINKPAGVIVNEATTASDETIQSWFWQKIGAGKDVRPSDYQGLIPPDFNQSFGTPEEIFGQRQGLVHRLDKETSGVLLLAKNPGSLVNLLSQFKKRQTKKKYLCLVHGKFGIESDTISAPLARSSQNRQKFAVKIEGREAVTSYKVLDYFPKLDLEKLAQNTTITPEDIKLLKKNKSSYQGFSLVECWPKTGRTHQIRVHMAHIKHPLVGDKSYVGKKRQKLDPIWCERHFLHASQITFTHPRSGQEMTLEADLSPDLNRVLTLLK